MGDNESDVNKGDEGRSRRTWLELEARSAANNR